jgi:hypothetical protein
MLEWYCGPPTSTLEECLYVINIHSFIDLKPVTDELLPFDPAQVVEGFHLHRASKPGGDE